MQNRWEISWAKKFFKGIIIPLIATLSFMHNASALTLEDATSFALENNHRIKEFKNLSEAQKERVESDKSPFWPSIDMTYDYERVENTFFFQTKDSSTFSAGISYNLFNGLKDIKTFKATQSEYEASLFERKAVQEDVILDAKRAYIAVLRAQQNLKVDEEAVELLSRQSREAELFWRTGVTAKNEFLKVEVELANTKEDLLKSQRNLQIARKTLERVIGVPVRKDEVIEEIAFREKIETHMETLIQLMLERRSELNFLRAQLKARKYTRDAIKGEYFPSIDLSLSHKRYGEKYAFEGREDPLFDEDTVGMATLKWNLFEGFRTKHDILAEESEIMAIQERIKDTVEQFRLQLSIALEEYDNSLTRMEVAKKAVEQAEENYRITDNQFRQRVVKSIDLIDARFFLTRAQNDYTNALYNHHLAIAAIERIIEEGL